MSVRNSNATRRLTESVHAIVLNYHASDKTACCVASLRGQDLAAVFVVDNSASREEFARLELAMADLRQDTGVRLETFAATENLGFGAGINAAISAIEKTGLRPTHYLLMNNDALAPPGLVRALLDKVHDSSGAGLVGPLIRQGDSTLGMRWYYKSLGHVSDRRPLFGGMPFLSGSCLLIDRALVRQGRLFDEDFFMYGEDIWLGAKTLAAGSKLAVAEGVTVQHEGSGSSAQGQLFYEYHNCRGHLLLAGKLAQGPLQLTAHHAGRIFYLLARSLLRAVRYRTAAPVLAYLLSWFRVRVRPSGAGRKTTRAPDGD